ncbi:MAG: 16S rRNA (cytidine(1402)-2'-O)-methyltransferase [Gammaproteobacteria bacterium]|nr:16S rRNA (cytidine(1402)-2'-O)-methyltransferase [Gammaproteobacteria bacterium]MCY4281644.1 16S rRNA (cytidine(1402)-2'-O)-methyltransferase [Gammaproteobacteria bacterium]MCY4339642.1 16S rRNA (cytidine(1402)-2'-O)-methyltransferase [Gammaproteobacteria bacterium]
MAKHTAGAPGALYIVATPIGNLEDLSPRAQRILASVDLILAEDTRHSARLLRAFDIRTRTLAFHEHNEARLTPRIVERLLNGESMALIADAGTPLISDPGFKLVRATQARDLTVTPAPGPSALVAALSCAGISPGKFLFEGFMPPREQARRRRLSELTGVAQTLVFYEAPHRIKAFMADAASTLGAEREACIARELTKTFETIRRGTLGGLRNWLEQDPEQSRGEFVVIIAGAAPQSADRAELVRLLQVLLASLSLKQAVRIATELSGAGRNEVYDLAVELIGEK